MEIKEAFHKWTNGGNTLVAYGPREEGGYSLLEYNGGKPKELFRSGSLEEVQRAFRDYYAVKEQFEKGMPWKVAGNHLVICREAPDGKFEVREYNSFKGRIEVPLERCETLREAREALEKYAELAGKMKDFNSLTERQQHFECALREARKGRPGFDRTTRARYGGIGRTIEIGR
ncbi:MAG: hypothetical protein JO025_22060 [Verrucomicrobia bacterium]|nr:hypothetical protein [Verrucomicrobiota bacterium]